LEISQQQSHNPLPSGGAVTTSQVGSSHGVFLHTHHHRHHHEQRLKPEGNESSQETAASSNDKKSSHENKAPKQDKFVKMLRLISIIGLVIVYAILIGFGVYKLMEQYQQYGRVDKSHVHVTFYDYLRYSFENWYTRSENANFIIVLTATLVTILIAAPLFSFIRHRGIFLSFWKVFGFLVDPGAAVGAETDGSSLHRVAELILSAAIAICGLVLFALLLMLLGDSFNDFVSTTSEGSSAVMESGQVMILGYQEEIPTLVQEICKAHEDHGGTTIVICEDKLSKSEMESKIENADVELLGSRVVVRCGKIDNASNLKKIGAHTASTVLILPDRSEPKEIRDAFALGALNTLRSKDFPSNGQIITACSLQKNYNAFTNAGGDVTRIVMLDSFLAQFMVKCGQSQDLALAFNLVLGFGGSEMYIEKVPKHLAGVCFSESIGYFRNAVPVGVMTSDGCTFCPGNTYTLLEDQEIVLFAEDQTSATALKDPIDLTGQKCALQTESVNHSRLRKWQVETMVILGWNEIAADVVFQLDGTVRPGSTLLILEQEDTKIPAQDAMQLLGRKLQRQIENFTNIHYEQGHLGSRFAIEELAIPIEQASRIFLFADLNANSIEHADAITLIQVLSIRDIFLRRGVSKPIAIVPEIRDALSKRKFLDLKIHDFVDSAEIPSQLMATIAYQPRVIPALEDLINPHTPSSFTTMKLSQYISAGQDMPDKITFHQAYAIVAASGDVALGWSLPYDETHEGQMQAELEADQEQVYSKCKKRTFLLQMCTVAKAAHNRERLHEYEINPADKFAERQWCWDQDQVIVITAKASLPMSARGRFMSSVRLVAHTLGAQKRAAAAANLARSASAVTAATAEEGAASSAQTIETVPVGGSLPLGRHQSEPASVHFATRHSSIQPPDDQ